MTTVQTQQRLSLNYFEALRKWKEFIQNGTAENFDFANISKFCTTKNVLWLETYGMMTLHIEKTLIDTRVLIIPTRYDFQIRLQETNFIRRLVTTVTIFKFHLNIEQ